MILNHIGIIIYYYPKIKNPTQNETQNINIESMYFYCDHLMGCWLYEIEFSSLNISNELSRC